MRLRKLLLGSTAAVFGVVGVNSAQAADPSMTGLVANDDAMYALGCDDGDGVMFGDWCATFAASIGFDWGFGDVIDFSSDTPVSGGSGSGNENDDYDYNVDYDFDLAIKFTHVDGKYVLYWDHDDYSNNYIEINASWGTLKFTRDDVNFELPVGAFQVEINGEYDSDAPWFWEWDFNFTGDAGPVGFDFHVQTDGQGNNPNGGPVGVEQVDIDLDAMFGSVSVYAFAGMQPDTGTPNNSALGLEVGTDIGDGSVSVGVLRSVGDDVDWNGRWDDQEVFQYDDALGAGDVAYATWLAAEFGDLSGWIAVFQSTDLGPEFKHMWIEVEYEWCDGPFCVTPMVRYQNDFLGDADPSFMFGVDWELEL